MRKNAEKIDVNFHRTGTLMLLTGWLRNLDNYKLFGISFFKALLRLILGERTSLAAQRKGNKENEEPAENES